MNIQDKISVLLELGKVKIAVPIAISCFTGFILHTPEISWQMFHVVFGIFLIVMGASALNHVQEYKKDALMNRTKFRPIPSGKISISEAVRWSALFLLAGCGFLAWGGNISSLWIAILSIFWYNLVYTPLKQFTAFAVVPGALSGAFPPWIGWVAAGGDILAPPILALSFFFFIGQIPHFWLLLMLYGEDYKQAGFKVLTDVFTRSQIRKITLIWMLATIVVALLLPTFRVISSEILIWALLIFSIWIIPNSFILLKKDERMNIRKLFLRLNLYFLLVMIMISIDRLYF
ncbi:protoheme IX farnesyltransferase [Marinifilum caeruleilacunae]|uniref:Protoheme IX farnesyltransferase n=1 Tax=Marinifilum caeruleilacunae TaxID=2499076 RepID=A0ABX1WWF0_9BACT|nr:protoheme IX farnesyltransferase [Marinifilum caeruleilacunae]NOU60448.1 protoheme IX farnesyltransferase [Marinifilum caeruleilacunae]